MNDCRAWIEVYTPKRHSWKFIINSMESHEDVYREARRIAEHILTEIKVEKTENAVRDIIFKIVLILNSRKDDSYDLGYKEYGVQVIFRFESYARYGLFT